MATETKNVRIYKKTWLGLQKIRRLLQREWGRQATFADAIRFLLQFYNDRESELK